MRDERDLIGTWSLLEWVNETATGDRTHPMGRDLRGLISYSSDGFVFVHIEQANRGHYAGVDPFGGTVAEDAAAMKSQITYAGRYRAEGDTVIHTVSFASFPNWIGTQQVRRFAFDGPVL